MNINTHRRLRISIVTLGLFAEGAVGADRVVAQAVNPVACLSASTCVPLTLTANVRLTKLHPTVTHVGMACWAKVVEEGGSLFRFMNGLSTQMSVVNRGYAGSLTATIDVPKSVLAVAANRTLETYCGIQLNNEAGEGPSEALATAAQPESITDSNWNVVATGSIVSWTRLVTFPNAAP
ncbi:MAG TPA: hypothetical protein VI485_16855 [Vicinamibacterales bacterium]|nr:hypothetical protein [Vicinamibacterales bacterium]